MHRNSTSVSTKQERIAALAKQSPQMAFTSLAYLIDIDWLKEAYGRTRKDGAVGVDGVTAEEYEQDLEGNLQRLLNRAKSGTYRAPPVRRVHIPKGGSTTETRPIGIPTLEDKVLQRAVVMLWSRSTNRTSRNVRTVSGAGDRHTRRWIPSEIS
jgi:retron-type reverse transcriptase